jgi:hypothetical protein
MAYYANCSPSSVQWDQVHAAAAAAGVETSSGPLEDSLPSFVAQTFQERYRVQPRSPCSCCVACIAPPDTGVRMA